MLQPELSSGALAVLPVSPCFVVNGRCAIWLCMVRLCRGSAGFALMVHDDKSPNVVTYSLNDALDVLINT